MKRKLGIGKNQTYGIRDKKGNVTSNMDKIVNVAEEFYRDLYSSQDNQDENGWGSTPEELDIPPVKKEEIKNALEAMKRGKAAGEDQVITDLLNYSGQIVIEKLATSYAQFLTTLSVPQSWKNANVVLIHKKEDVKDLENYRPISLVYFAYNYLLM